ncbi:MAG: tetratricopeptide repeat protein [Legionellales bacterium]|jgi:predicted TPR repeat methyltransferase/thioredoxin-like negative regulator of GroEL|nr:tetratricopeptide repeat protein [Legionellales bacterium]
MTDTLSTALDQHKQDKHEPAEEKYLKLLKQDPCNIEILHLLAISNGQRGNLEQAAEYITKALEQDSSSAYLYNSYANIVKYQGNDNKAQELYQKSISLEENNPASYYNLGLIFIKKNKNKQAISHIEQAIKLKPDYIDAYHVLIKQLHKMHEIKKASKLIEKTAKIGLTHPIFTKLRAQNQQYQNDIGNAIKNYEQYLCVNNNDYDAHHHLATAYLIKGDVQTATRHNLAALEINPEHEETHHNLAVTYLTQNKLDLALKHWLRALSIAENIDYLYNIGVVYNYKGHYTDSLSYFEKSLKLDAKHYNSIVNIAVIYIKKNMPPEARFYFKKALEIKPNDEQNLYMLAALDGKQDNFKEAPRTYVKDLFDQYANTFEEHLQKVLSYKAPEIIYDMLSKYCDIENKEKLNVCDIGCGTGLMGTKLYEHCASLIGVDLSEKMLEQARTKNIYTDLIHEDINDFLKTKPNSFNLITAADVIPYYGDITELFGNIKSALATGGYFIFSVEASVSADYSLGKNARFTHGKEYILAVADKLNLSIIGTSELSTRKEGSNEIECNSFILEKTD